MLIIVKVLASIIIGFIFWKSFSGAHEGERIERSIRPIIFGHCVHIHHWIWCSVILTGLLYSDMTSYFTIGLLVGSILQGLKYRDRFVIVYKPSEFANIYARFKVTDEYQTTDSAFKILPARNSQSRD